MDLGGVRVDVLCDVIADHPLALHDAFPGVPTRGWDAARKAHPETLGVAGRWRLPVHVALVRTPEASLLIDAGVGPAGTAAARWLKVSGTLDADLARLGLEPRDIDLVVLTHLHRDHVGWLTAPLTGRPTFVGARHVVSGAEWTSTQSGAMASSVSDALEPVRAAGLLDVDGVLPEGVRLVPLAGHTPGHSGVVIEGRRRRLLFAGDAFNHPLQLTEPDVPSIADADRPQAAATRRELLELARRERLAVLGAHLPGAMWSAS